MAHRRVTTVLLCSHFERYIYAVNEEAVDYLNARTLASERIPLRIRLLQARPAIDLLAQKSWEQRESLLVEFVSTLGSMWSPGTPVGTLVPAPNLVSMKAPTPDELVKFYRLFGVHDIFAAVTRSHASRGRLRRTIQSLVENRNGIAHGDRTVQPLRIEITEYLNGVDRLSDRADSALARALSSITSSPAPW